MDENYLLAATRYIELNPVKAGLVKSPEKYLCSSAQAHLTGEDDDLVTVKPLLKMVDDWRKFLAVSPTEEEDKLIHRHEQTGRPLGSVKFINRLENKLSRILQPQKGGRPRKNANN
jgi:putative transposase